MQLKIKFSAKIKFRFIADRLFGSEILKSKAARVIFFVKFISFELFSVCGAYQMNQMHREVEVKRDFLDVNHSLRLRKHSGEKLYKVS